MNRKRFERLVEGALGRIPEPFRQAMDNVAVIVEDWPSHELMDEMYGDPDTYVYGLFTGTPLTERHVDDFGDLPATIHLYQAALEQDFADAGDLEHELTITLVHEIAHYMGFDEDQLDELGFA